MYYLAFNPDITNQEIQAKYQIFYQNTNKVKNSLCLNLIPKNPKTLFSEESNIEN
jgi:hypothetical protein